MRHSVCVVLCRSRRLVDDPIMPNCLQKDITIAAKVEWQAFLFIRLIVVSIRIP